MPDITGINSGSISTVSSFISSFARISIFYLNTTLLNKIFPKNFQLARKGKKIKEKLFMLSNLYKRDKKYADVPHYLQSYTLRSLFHRNFFYTRLPNF
jgi:hypothetical protein